MNPINYQLKNKYLKKKEYSATALLCVPCQVACDKNHKIINCDKNQNEKKNSLSFIL
jgi:hypothetical protein